MKDRSPWIELHLSVVTHRKTWQLAEALGIDRVAALGHICSLWLWALEQAQDGDLSHFPAQAIADGAGWRRRAQKFVEALDTSGYIDEDLQLHDWGLYVEPLMERRRKDRERKRTPSEPPTVPPRNSSGKPRGIRKERARHLTTTSPSTSPHLTSGGDGDAARTGARDGLRIDAEEILYRRYGREPSNRDVWRVVDLMEAHGVERVNQAFQEAAALDGRSIAYVEKVLNSWAVEGVRAG